VTRAPPHTELTIDLCGDWSYVVLTYSQLRCYVRYNNMIGSAIINFRSEILPRYIWHDLPYYRLQDKTALTGELPGGGIYNIIHLKSISIVGYMGSRCMAIPSARSWYIGEQAEGKASEPTPTVHPNLCIWPPHSIHFMVLGQLIRAPVDGCTVWTVL